MQDMEQNTEEWLKNRLDGIGASDAPAIMGRSLYHTKLEIWDIKFHKILETEEERKKKKFICDKGHRLEAWARPGIEFSTGLTWRPALFEHQNFPFIRASLDGWNAQVCEAWECKFMGAELFKILSDESLPTLDRIPPQYFDQIMQQFFVTGAKAVRLTGVIEFVENKEERKAQKEAGQEQDKKIITLKSYTLIIKRDEKIENYIKETLAPALFEFWKSVQDGVRPEAEKKDVLKTDNKEFIEMVKTYGQLFNQKKELEEKAKKNSTEIMGDIAKKVSELKSSIENHAARNHEKMDIEGFKLTEKKGRAVVDYEAAFNAFIGWVHNLRDNADMEQVWASLVQFPDKPSLEKYTKAGKPSFLITIPKEKKEPELKSGDKVLVKDVPGFESGVYIAGPETIAETMQAKDDKKELDAWKNPLTGKMPKGWKTKGNEWRFDYVKKQIKKANDEQKQELNNMLELLTPKKETIGGITFE